MSGSDGAGVRTRFQRDPGVSFIAIATQVGPTRGVEIDNPCGSWLYIPSLETFIPPYTTGWQFGFPYDVAALDIRSRDLVPFGPAGQISTLQGEPVVVYLTDLQLERKAGVASGNAPTGMGSGSPTSDQNFIREFTPILNAVVLNIPCVSGPQLVTPVIAPIPNKRFRVLSFTLDSEHPALRPYLVRLEDSTGIIYQLFKFTWNETGRSQLYPGGLDFPVGVGVSVGTNSQGAGDATCGVEATYQVI